MNPVILLVIRLVVNTLVYMVQALKTRSNGAFWLIYHLVLVTKYRKKSLTAEMLDRMHILLKELLLKWECEVIEFGGEADHIHLLFETHPSVELVKLVNNIKTITSREASLWILRTSLPVLLEPKAFILGWQLCFNFCRRVEQLSLAWASMLLAKKSLKNSCCFALLGGLCDSLA